MKIKVFIFYFLCLLISNTNYLKAVNQKTINNYGKNICSQAKNNPVNSSSTNNSGANKNSKNTSTHNYANIKGDLKNISRNPFVPIVFTPDGLNRFFENIYNKEWYATEFLPRNFMHMTQFLQYGKNTKQNGAFLKSVLKLFSNKIKGSTCISSYAFLDLIEIMPEFLTNYFKAPEINLFNFNKSSINNLIYNDFLINFNDFKNNPKIFIDGISKNIVNYLNNEAEKNKKAEIIDTYVNLEHLRKSVKNFLELSLSKIAWSPEDHKNIWDLFFRTTKALEEFHVKKIIDDVDDMDDIYWSLVHRFCDLLKLTATDLPIEFYVHFNSKILSSQLSMFQIEEQEKAITSKETRLVQSLLSAQAKARSYQQSVITT